MNKRPVSYLQVDKRWKDKPYRVKGESATIGGSGCGPACAAMVIATLKDPTVTPVETCAWSVDHGYKALNQGTYYAYFRPQLAAYGIACRQLLPRRIINQPDHPIHEQVREYLAQGYYVIALMGPGTWTKSGHFVLMWGWDDKVRINDPASTRSARLNGDPATFRNEARCYWLVDARGYNTPDNGKDDFSMDLNEARVKMTSCAGTGDRPSDWARDATDYCKRKGIFCGDGEGNYGWQQPITREAVAQINYNLLEAAGMLEKLPDVK